MKYLSVIFLAVLIVTSGFLLVIDETLDAIWFLVLAMIFQKLFKVAKDVQK